MKLKLSQKYLSAGSVLLFSLLLALFLLFRFAGGNGRTEDEAFAAFTRQLFLKDVSSNTMTLHYTLSDPASYGIEDAPVTFGTYTPDSQIQTAADIDETKETLSSFSRQKLSGDNQLLYDILKVQLKTEQAAASFPYYEEIFSPSLGIQAQLPVLLAEYTFRSEKDVQDYLHLISQMDTYYESLLLYQQEKSEAGLFMSDETAEAVIAQCRSFLAHPAEHFLLSTFEERVNAADFLPEENRQNYIDTNRALVFGHVFPAYELLIDGLAALEGTGVNTGGLCRYEQGREYYEAHVACTVGTGRSMDEIKELIDESLNQDLKTISDVLGTHPELLKTTSTNLDSLEPEAILETLEQKIQADFPAAEAVSCKVKYVEPSLEDYLSPAFYLAPPLDLMQEHLIYLNPAEDCDGLSLFTTLAHEGYPGHLYQTLCESTSRPNPVCSIFYFGGFTEGWATYAERCAYSYASLSPDMAALLAANSSISLGLYAKADVGIHYEGWNESDLAGFLYPYGITKANTIHSVFQAIVQDPGNYLKYYLGAVEIEKLKEQAEAALSDQFILKDFHAFLLSTGPAPFPVLEDYLEKWVTAVAQQ